MQNTDIQNLSAELDSVFDDSKTQYKTITKQVYDPVSEQMLQTEEMVKIFNPKIELENSEIKVTEKLEPPIVSLQIGDGIVSTLGNILTLIGKAKSRKSFLISIAIAVATDKDFVFNAFKSHLPNDKCNILLFDTEQSKYHVQLALKRICKMIGINEPKNIKVYGLRKYSPEERTLIVEFAIYNTKNLGIVFIDGIKDLMYDTNDINESSKTVTKLMKWTEELNISLVTVLHQNKGDNNARGHLGTELMNKSETVISVTKSETDKDISIVEPVACRNIDFEPFGFEIDENGIPVIAENFQLRTSTKKDKFDILEIEDFKKFQLLTEVFSKQSECSYKDLQTQLKLAFKNQFKKDIGLNAIVPIITYCKNNGMIVQPEGAKKPYKLGIFNSTIDY